MDLDEALILEERVAKLGRPHRNTVQALDNWTKRLGPSILTDHGAERLRDQNDLIAPKTPPDHDWLIRFVRRYLRVFFLVRVPSQVPLADSLKFTKILNKFQEDGYRGDVAYISEAKITRAVNLFGMFITALLLICAIVNLYLIQNPNTRLGLIGGYTCAFALSLGILTNARRAELYGSTAALVWWSQTLLVVNRHTRRYAAVLVVFVSGDLASPKSS